MSKYFLGVIISFLLGYSLGIIGYWVLYQKLRPPWGDHLFVQACGELNGKEEFTLATIKDLNGYCYENCRETGCTTTTPCDDKHINRFKDFVEACGKFITDEAQLSYWKRNEQLTEASSLLQSCEKNFNSNSPDNWVGTAGMFWITQGGTSGNWQCRIERIKPFIKAVPFYHL